MKRPFTGEAPAPDHLRCRRTDGRGWRCPRRALGRVTFCDHHHRLQRTNFAKHAAADANPKRKVTSSAKPKRKTPLPNRLPPPPPPPPQMEELIGMALRRQMERREERERLQREAAAGAAVEVVRKDLPNGVMAISSPKGFDNAGTFVDRKIGFDDGQLFQRSFRSKNAEPLSVATFKELPYCRDSPRVRKRVCHRCSESKLARMVRCLGCSKYFCTGCIKKWYSEMSELEFRVSCPTCRGSCTCKTCRKYGSEDDVRKDSENNQKHFGKIRYAHYLIRQLLPVLKQINAKQITELELEATNRGRKLSGIQLQVVQYSHNELLNCNCCGVSIADLHRSCLKCYFKLCLRCCQDIRGGSLSKGVAVISYRCPSKGKPSKQVSKKLNRLNRTYTTSPALPAQKVNNGDSTISCPPKETGGCGEGILNLIFVLPLGVPRYLK